MTTGEAGSVPTCSVASITAKRSEERPIRAGGPVPRGVRTKAREALRMHELRAKLPRRCNESTARTASGGPRRRTASGGPRRRPS